MNKLTPLVKGIITGIVLVILSLVLYYSKTTNSRLNYLIYIIYALGIAWTLVSYSRSPAFTARFADSFGQGFRCFIIVTLIMVAFTAVFTMQHPEFAEEAASYYRTDLIKQGNKTPNEIEELVAQAKKRYPTSIISITIFGYLITGAVFTAAGAALLMRRK